MAHHGYIPLIKQYIHQQVPKERPPLILEVGVDRGVTTFPLVAFLARTRPSFAFFAIDILLQEQVNVMLSNLDLQPSQQVFYVKGNSLEVLPKMVDQGMKFDVILIDGDHNYHTVAEELKHVEALTQPGALVICDDYDGRWADKDLWYAEREGYEEVDVATKKVETEKHGVKAAIDEWLENHPEWQKAQPIQGEPIMLMRKAI
jgi:predicted O-methyltransferase YrrM